MKLGIIGGTGASPLFADAVALQPRVGPWGPASGEVRKLRRNDHELYILPRHSWPGTPGIAPHRVNYRANVWALHELGVDHVVGLNAVGGIAPALRPGTLVLPQQLIDYTWGREHSYTGEAGRALEHVEFTDPFCKRLHHLLFQAAERAGLAVHGSGVYGVTQGPRLETAAEIDRLDRDGCTVVGMTAMPEAVLARELSLSYAIVCLVVNQAAGRGAAGGGIHAQMAAHLEAATAQAGRLLDAFLVP